MTSHEMTILGVIGDARDVLAKKGWTQHVTARDKWGFEVSIHDKKAAKFCAIGAIYKASLGLIAIRLSAEKFLLAEINSGHRDNPFCNVASWNDMPMRTKKDVLQLFDKVIDRLEKNA